MRFLSNVFFQYPNLRRSVGSVPWISNFYTRYFSLSVHYNTLVLRGLFYLRPRKFSKERRCDYLADWIIAKNDGSITKTKGMYLLTGLLAGRFTCRSSKSAVENTGLADKVDNLASKLEWNRNARTKSTVLAGQSARQNWISVLLLLAFFLFLNNFIC